MKVGYARVSSRRQADTEALEQQCSRLEKMGCDRVMLDVGSGRSDRRKEFNQILKMAKDGLIKEVVVTRLDRLGRNVIAINRAMQLFKECGVKLTMLDSPIGDTESAFGWLTANNIAGLAEFESRLLAERVEHGVAYYRENLRYFGNPPFGYTKNKDGRLEPHPSNWLIAKEIVKRLYSNSYGSIARWLIESFEIKMYGSSLRNWIHNPCLRGHTFYKLKGGEVEKHYNTHEALITEAEYAELARLTSYPDKKDPNKFKPHILGGVFKCMECGHAMTKSKAGKQFQCAQYRKFGNAGCTNGCSIAKTIVKKEVAKVLVQHARQILKLTNDQTVNADAVDDEMLKLQSQLDTLRSLPQNEAIDKAIADTQIQIQARKAQSKQRASRSKDDFLILNSFLHPDFWESLSDEEFKAVASRFLERVEFSRNRKFSFFLRSNSNP
ncbi:MAG: recombinase family protein [Calothrix sp. C42_A2020_038]|nr:recombinase family protein [Calothrix sp. C42_A2020_038]